MTVADLPDNLTMDPETEALELGIDVHVFQRLEDDKDPEGLGPLRAYLVLDGSADPEIPLVLEGFNDPARCLFDGQAFEDLGDVAPWIAEPVRFGGLWDWYVENGWGKDWGVIIFSRLPMARLKTHLKKFLRVEDEDGEVYFFKFYRPGHFQTYIPVLEPDQRAAIGKGMESVLTEVAGTPGRAVEHRLSSDGGYLAKEIDLAAIGEPLRPIPPTPADVDAILTALQQQE